MKCEEFEAVGLDAERDAMLSEIECVAAREHANTCSRCAALQESWQSAREELRALGEATMAMQAPSRVEMRLRQEFRTKHRTMKTRRAAVVAAWALATAAVLVGAVSWRNWQVAKHRINSPSSPVLNLAGAGANGSGAQNEALNNSSTTVPGEDGAGDFTLLPGTLLAETDEAAILRVRMQRGSLGALGFPVNEARAGEWIQVDLLVGDDGLPQAVRLAR